MSGERLSKNFTRDEFACHCGCGFDEVDPRLVAALQEVRDIAGRAVHINSGCRCQEHNASIGGSPKSQHLLGKAADIVIKGYSQHVVQAIVERVEAFRNGGIGTYRNFTHCDVRDGRARW